LENIRWQKSLFKRGNKTIRTTQPTEYKLNFTKVNTPPTPHPKSSKMPLHHLSPLGATPQDKINL